MGSDGPARRDGHRDPHDPRVPVVPQHQVHGPGTQVGVGQHDRGEHRPQPLGEVGAVERDDRDVARDREPVLGQGLVGAHRDPVVHADDPGRRPAVPEERGHRLEALAHGPAARDLGGHVGTGRPQRVADPVEAQRSRDRPTERALTDDMDPRAEPAVEQGGDRGPAPFVLVGHDRRQARRPVDAVEQHGPLVAQHVGDVDLRGDDLGVDDPVDPAVEHLVDQQLLELDVALGLADQDHVVLGPGRDAGAGDHLAGERAAGHQVGDHPDGAGGGGAQVAGAGVGPVVEIDRRAAYPLLGRDRDPHLVGAAVEDVGRGGGGHSRQLRDVREGRATSVGHRTPTFLCRHRGCAVRHHLVEPGTALTRA